MSATSATWLVAVVGVVVVVVWRVVEWVWVRPKRVEKVLRTQGFDGNPYRVLIGDTREMYRVLLQAAKSQKPTNFLSDHNDVAPHLTTFNHHIVNKFGKKSFSWEGPTPKVIITEPEHIKEIFNKMQDFGKPKLSPIFKLLGTGLANLEGDTWRMHRKIINPAFHLEKLKVMLPIFSRCCDDMVSKWEEMLSSDDKCEIDVWPYLQSLTCDIISRTAFGSSYEEGKRIFELLKEQGGLIMKSRSVYIPGWWLLPTTTHRRIKQIDTEIRASLKGIINKREEAMKAGEVLNNDLLGMLLESNRMESQEHGNNKNLAMTNQEVIEECNAFYIAGQETTSVLLVWTMILLSRHPDWQARARDEVLEVFGNQKPDYNGLSHLKIVTMILYEVLRLYPPVVYFSRAISRDVKLGNLSLPAGVQVSIPILLIHHDRDIWGDDATEFKPERFSEGVAKATKGQVTFFPFGWGPRVCIGQNFALLEAKLVLSLLLQRFSFELSPAYTHAPATVLTLHPKHGAHIILRKL
ncbi:11-oxo-beta-amyrin 30-oxidase [Cajanus cajan]|uniref:Secologanin synthase n=1 Tax=Cajanus cajan TaxID=3821 RepID=A0A151S278_CAJCA|nr:11-oxo-beta-amyrin 30-oxidase [Cajanus cajan]KYP48913.1 Secologanin synthase [Cajanus cajan]